MKTEGKAMPVEISLPVGKNKTVSIAWISVNLQLDLSLNDGRTGGTKISAHRVRYCGCYEKTGHLTGNIFTKAA